MSRSNYVNMGAGSGITSGNADITNVGGYDNPSLSTEEKDRRLALALQQQENAAVYDTMKKKHDGEELAQKLRTTRSNVSTGLAAIRKKEREQSDSPPNYESGYSGNYNAPGGHASDPDAQLAMESHRIDQACAGTAKMMEHITEVSAKDKASKDLRNARSGQGAFKK